MKRQKEEKGKSLSHASRKESHATCRTGRDTEVEKEMATCPVACNLSFVWKPLITNRKKREYWWLPYDGLRPGQLIKDVRKKMQRLSRSLSRFETQDIKTQHKNISVKILWNKESKRCKF